MFTAEDEKQAIEYQRAAKQNSTEADWEAYCDWDAAFHDGLPDEDLQMEWEDLSAPLKAYIRAACKEPTQ